MDSNLQGHGNIKGIVSVKANRKGEAVIWQRIDGKVIKSTDSFAPFILSSNFDLINDLPFSNIITLEGDLDYKYKVEVSNFTIFEASLIDRYRKKFDKNVEKVHDMNHIKIFNTMEQYLIQSGNNYYKGQKFDDILRMQIDIETTGLLDDLEARVFMIAIKSSNGFEKVIHGYDERKLLLQLSSVIKRIDPDIIENHNLFGFDLPFLYRRYEYHNLNFDLGRDHSAPFIYQDTLKHGGNTTPFNRYHVTGRELIDTLHSVKRYDGMTRKLGGKYGLKDSAVTLGVNRTDEDSYIPGDQIFTTYKEDPRRVIKYALYDVREVDGLVKKLNQDKFILSQIIPMSYEKICTVGSSKVIELPMVRHYLKQNHSIPAPMSVTSEERKKYTGGYVEVFKTGVIEHVTKLDVKSMYPNIILANNISPHADPLNYFETFLKSVTQERYRYKNLAEKNEEFGPIQNALKIVINSSYEYLGCAHGLFNNIYGAMEVTKKGQEIIQEMVQLIKDSGGLPIEADTDGVICNFPINYSPERYCATIQENLDKFPYITIEPEPKEKAIDKIYIYSKKNYAYFENDELKIYGSALRSKAKPPIFREFIREGIKLILQDKLLELDSLYNKLHEDIKNRKIPIEKISKTMSLGKSLPEYIANKSKSLPHYEVWINVGITDRPKGARTEHYRCEGDERYKLSQNYGDDYDVEYYLRSLEDCLSILLNK